MGRLVNGVGLLALLWFHVFVVHNVVARDSLSFSKYEEEKTVIGGNDKGGDTGCEIGNCGVIGCGDYGGGAESGRDGSGGGDYGCGGIGGNIGIGSIRAPSPTASGLCNGDVCDGRERKSEGSGIGKGRGFGGEVGTGFGFGGGGTGHH
ncbi:unnamed protein product [Microthlaspi erraticum]|uniref:Glycine-rich protein n=1 Tax=Microthlaspi erraticum TaxID=1685480 RepID=A0A6D2IR10_9BRAS|nr:unnamed protein product [Microthlaspi erraticum]